MKARRAFVLGWPVAHSRSPLIHRHWLERYGIPGDYVRQGVPPDEVEQFLSSFAPDFAGGNVTLPYKETAFQACDEATPVASRLEAANTLWRDGDRLCGDNTDVYGFAANLDEAAPDWRSGEVCLLLGAGGASRAVVQAVLDAGFRTVLIINRTLARAEAVAAHFGTRVVAEPLEAVSARLAAADLIVNSTSAELSGSGAPPLDWTLARSDAIATDLVYVPLMTPFLQGAADRGLRTVDGLGMLLHQAVPGFERWFGVHPEVTPELRSRVVADLAG